jgi:hypothetical protein
MFSKYVDIEGTAIHYFHTGPSTLPGVAPALDRGELLLFLHDRAVPRHGMLGLRHSGATLLLGKE